MINIPEHYARTLAKQGLAPQDLPDTLYFTFAGDILGSCGEHYAYGKDITIDQAARRANPHYSDDFAESLAMHQLAAQKWSRSPEILIKQRDQFLDIIRSHYIAYGLQYSPWAAALFEEKLLSRYLVLLAHHSGCGTIMRAAALAPHQELEGEKLLPFFLITHANLQAVEGGFFGTAFARAALNGHNFQQCIENALAEGIKGRALARAFLEEHKLPIVKDQSVSESIDTVIASGNPYAAIGDIGEDGIETHFVASSAIKILADMEHAPKTRSAQTLVEKGLKIGGDPDTICSVAMAFYGLLHPQECKESLAEITLPFSQ